MPAVEVMEQREGSVALNGGADACRRNFQSLRPANLFKGAAAFEQGVAETGGVVDPFQVAFALGTDQVAGYLLVRVGSDGAQGSDRRCGRS